MPLRKFSEDTSAHTSDLEARMLSKLVLAGTRSSLRWSFVGAFLLRPEARLGSLPGPEGSVAGSEAQFGASLQYVHPGGRFALGPEASYATLVTPREYAFKPNEAGVSYECGLDTENFEPCLANYTPGQLHTRAGRTYAEGPRGGCRG